MAQLVSTIPDTQLPVPPGGIGNLIADISLSNADLTATNYIGVDGVTGSSPTLLTPFDFRQYSEVYASLIFATLTGGATPKAGLVLWGYHGKSATYLATPTSQQVGAVYATSPVNFVMGKGFPVSQALETVTAVNQPTCSSPILPAFAYFQPQSTGTPTGWTSARLVVSGWRR